LFEILSWRAALEDPPGLTPPVYPQAQIDPIDVDILLAGIAGQGVVFGAGVTASDPEALTVDVAAGQVVIAGTAYDVDATADLAIATPNLTQPRYDLVLADDSGTPFIASGVPATHSPPFPALPSDAVALAAIYVPHALTEILTAHIVDKRVPVSVPVAASAGWNTITATSDLTRSNTASLALDDVLQFPMSPSTKYRFRGRATFSALAASDLRIGWLGPTSPSLVVITDDIGNPLTTAGANRRQIGAFDVSGRTSTFTSNQVNVVDFEGIVHNGSNADDFGLAWAQAAAVAENTVRRAGSYLEWEEVA